MSDITDELSVADNPMDPSASVAIIGMAGRFPGARDVAELWQNLLDGKDTITRFKPAEDVPDYVAARGTLEDVGLFDADFFGIVPREAERMDPQHRLFLEACHNALEDAGYVPQEYTGEIGLFGGCALNTYLLQNLCADREFIDNFTKNYQVGEFQILTGNDKDFLTTRTAYKLDLRGPVVSVQSACATSLVAVAQACQSLLTYQCDMALAGGASITFPQLRGHMHTEGSLASSDGYCRPFDANASGTVFSHGVGVVVLKRLDDALRDGDHVSAVIRGFAVNNDGAQKAGYMAPGVDGQARVIAAAQAMAGVSPDTISYVEAHGTGTPMGDPIEVAALTKAFRAHTNRTGFCTIGAAKGNIGHLDAAAGVTGLIKTTMSLEKRTLPGLAHFSAPNPHLNLEESPFRLSATTQAWESATPRRAGVSAFGVGGVNAHVVLEEAPAVASETSSRAAQTLCVSARSAEASKTAAENLAEYFEQHPESDLADVSFTLAVGRRAFDHRVAVSATDAVSAVKSLRAAAAKAGKAATRRVAFTFSGQGSQFVGMGFDLYATEVVYRGVIDDCASVAAVELGFDLRTLIFGEANEQNAEKLGQTQFAQPALFMTELALARLWERWGVRAEALVGHSLGEYVAATLAGIFKVEDAMRLVCVRGRLMQQMQPGAMLSVPLAEDALAPYLRDGISVAGLNSPRASVLAGSFEAIAEVEKELEAAGIAARRLKTSHAFHSMTMEPMLDVFAGAFTEVVLNEPTKPMVSTVTGNWITASEATSPTYWVEQVRKPVRFAQAVATLRASGIDLFLEAGPGEVLTTLAGHQRSGNGFSTIASLPMPREGNAVPIQKALGELWSAGVPIEWAAYFAEERRQRVSLPTYPFERKLYWIEPPAAPSAIAAESIASLPENPPMSITASPEINATTSRKPRIELEVANVLTELSGVAIGSEEMSVSFLELGFDSLFLTQAALTLSKKFGTKITFRQLMEQFGSVALLAGHLDAVMPPDAPKPVAVVAAPAAPAPVPTAAAVAMAAAPQVLMPAGSTSAIETLFAQQLATLTSVFQSQMASLQAAGGQVAFAAPQPAAIAAPAAPAAATPPPVAKPATATDSAAAWKPLQTRASQDITPEQQRYIDQLVAKYQAMTPNSKKMTAESRPHLADPRAVAGFRPQWKEMVYPLLTDRANGSRIWDVDGNEYIDIVNGYGCIMFGHSPDFVVEAAHAQLDRGVAIGPQSVLAGEVAAMVRELTGNERVTFCNTGSEAVMAAIRVARTITGKHKFVYFTGDYHGTFDEVLIRRTPRGSAPIAPGIPQENVNNVVVLDYGTDASLDYIREHADEIAAVLIEPVQTRHPDNKPFEFIRTIREITAQNEIAMILDEVVTGFRVAPGGVQEYLGIRADMCTYGKVIGGGHPIGVLSGKAQYLDALDGGAWNYGDTSAPEVGMTFFAGTFVRHPLALAAARSVLNHLKTQGPQMQENLNRKTKELAERLDAFFVERGVPARIDSFASWFYWTFPSDSKLAPLFYYVMRSRGIHIQEGYPCFLTTAHTDADLAAVETAFRETILEMQAAGALPSSAVSSNSAATTEPEPKEPALHPLALRNTPDRVTLTEPQREIFLAAALNEEANCAFNESLTVRLHGPVRQDDLRFALDAVIARHDALRSVVCEDGDCLCIAPVYSGETEFIDLRGESAEQQQAKLAALIKEEGRTAFDLHEGPLVRSTCIINSDTDVVLMLTAHHIVLDGWSANQLLDEIAQVYSRGSSALTELAPLLPFSSYAVRENERQNSGEFGDNEKFWVAQFAGRSPRLDLPTDRPRPTSKSYKGATFEGTIDKDLYESLKKLSAKNGCSLYVTMLSSFQLLMHRLTRQDEVVVGISTAGQSLMEDASLVGHCVNFLPMLSELRGGETVQDHLKSTRSALLDAQDHQEFTYGSLLRKLTLEREPGRLPLIEVQFNLEKVGNNVRFAGLDAAIKPSPKQYVNTDLFLNAVETPNGIEFTCDYNTDLFEASTLTRWMNHWRELLASEVNDATAKVADLNLLSAEDVRHLTQDWNQTETLFGAFEALPVIVAKHAQSTPQRVAMECAGRHWTWAELHEYATMLAHRLVHEGLKPGQLVGICIERSLEMAGALVAVMMAGAAYVPLDPRHPRERLATIIEDAGMALLLTGRDPSVDTTAKILNITGPQPKHDDVLPSTIAANSLAYVIYTSGSTGKPKGVAIEHSALMNLLRSMQREPGLQATDVLVAVTTLAFDIAALELFLPMLSGAKLVIATDEQVTNGTLLLALMQECDATVLQATPGAWRILLDAGWSNDLPLKALCGGEALPRELADNLLVRAAEVWNVYGPTETTIWSSATRVAAGKGSLRIGPPIANTQFYVLEANNRPAPIGVVGELVIGGDGLARGYWNRAELTAEKFLPNPYAAGRMYKTGDLARLHKDGSIELLGRVDFQVKIRGYRIELGEIEAALAKHPAVREAIVLDQKPAGAASARLLAYIDAGAEHTNESLADDLHDLVQRSLPAYMIPHAIAVLPEFPRLPNTKVDRKALLRMDVANNGAATTAARPYTAPATEQEKQMSAIWAEILQLERVSTTDSIFELGADSLAIFRIAARAQREGLPVKATQIFEHRTIQGICQQFAQKTDAAPVRATSRIAAAPRSSYRITK